MRFVWMLPLVFALLPLAPNPGVVFEIEVTFHGASSSPVGGDDETETTVVQVEAPHARFALPAGEGFLIYRGDDRSFVGVDAEAETFVVVDAEAVAEFGKQLEQAVKDLTEEDRVRLRKEGARIPGEPGWKRPPLRYERTGEGEHAGSPCTTYDVFQDEEKVRALCMTDWNQLDGGDEVRTVFRDLAGRLAEFTETMGEGGLFMPGWPFGEGHFDAMQELDAFPVVTREFDLPRWLEDEGVREIEATLLRSERRRLDPAEFEPPAGYKRRSMFGGN